MNFFGRLMILASAAGLCVAVASCGGGSSPHTQPAACTLTVNSTNPASGVQISYTENGSNVATTGKTSFTITADSGTKVTLDAPSTASGNNFSSWAGCTSASSTTCNQTLTTNATVTVSYTAPAVSSVTITPNPASATIGGTVQFAATVNGSAVTNNSVTWTVAAPSGSSLSAGTISSTGLYTTPNPAPATATVTATSVQDTSVSGSVTVTLSAPAAATGPSLSVDVSNETHPISPYIYGINGYLLDSASEVTANPTVVRWGGDATSRYNYKLNTTNSAADYYFENFSGEGGMWGGGNYTGFITASSTAGITSLMTMPVLGWVTNSSTTACSFTQSQFPGQTSYNGSCGSGTVPEGTDNCTTSGGCDLFGDTAGKVAALTSISNPAPTPPAASGATLAWAQGTWAGGWVGSILSAYGPGNPSGATGKSVAIWDLDNEPAWWDEVHRDVHPVASTYDEVTNGGIGTALAIKTVDSTAQVSGPVIDYWWNYFYSKKDIESGWSSGAPCYEPWSNPVDRNAHGGVPMIEYYLQQMAAAEKTYGFRLLDYLDIHAYMAATVNGNSVGLAAAGDTGVQQARMNSTRAYWDPTYTDPNFPQPNYTTDSNYTSSCTTPLQAPQAIPMMQAWVAKDYPGTKISIDEYNFGGLESINGAVAQADVLGIFGREGLDMGMFWPTTNDNQQIPGNFAFAIYRNYDGKQSTFGDISLNSSSADQSQLAVYGALRSKDGTVTIVVINKTYGDLTATLSVNALSTSTTSAQAYLYSNANLSQIVGPASVTVTPPSGSATASTISTIFPAQSITLLTMAN
jgi:Glycoside hydrolase family 44